MSEAYPLESLLSVRLFREETARRNVFAAQSQLKAAAEALERARDELEAWRAWKAAEVERRYDALIGRSVTIKALTAFNADLAALADGELLKRMAVDDARTRPRGRAKARRGRQAGRAHGAAKYCENRGTQVALVRGQQAGGRTRAGARVRGLQAPSAGSEPRATMLEDGPKKE